MHILCLGLNHQTADISLRERLAFNEESVKAALSRLSHWGELRPESGSAMVIEMVILSTCHRVEIYAASRHPDFAMLERFLAEEKGVPQSEVAAHRYNLLDEEAVEHLFRVSSGLDSLVIGEPQILGQVTGALDMARSQGAAGPVLSRLFQSALHTGKRARAETGISHNPVSISSVAIRLAERAVPDLLRAKIAVLGAGEMAELAVEALRKRGVSQIRVVNRTLERARQLADRWGGETAEFNELPEILDWADILIASTGAPHTVIVTELVSRVMSGRPNRPLVIVDIAVPRDVDPAVGDLAGVRLFDVDMLHEHLEHSLASRLQEVPRVEAILGEERQAFLNYFISLDVFPVIVEMREQAESIRQAELEKTLRRMGDLSPQERKRLEALTQALVKKILHAPIAKLREEAGSPNAAHYAAVVRNLFDLESSR